MRKSKNRYFYQIFVSPGDIVPIPAGSPRSPGGPCHPGTCADGSRPSLHNAYMPWQDVRLSVRLSVTRRYYA